MVTAPFNNGRRAAGGSNGVPRKDAEPVALHAGWGVVRGGHRKRFISREARSVSLVHAGRTRSVPGRGHAIAVGEDACEESRVAAEIYLNKALTGMWKVFASLTSVVIRRSFSPSSMAEVKDLARWPRYAKSSCGHPRNHFVRRSISAMLRHYQLRPTNRVRYRANGRWYACPAFVRCQLAGCKDAGGDQQYTLSSFFHSGMIYFRYMFANPSWLCLMK
jgi:hypothetical protein